MDCEEKTEVLKLKIACGGDLSGCDSESSNEDDAKLSQHIKQE